MSSLCGGSGLVEGVVKASQLNGLGDSSKCGLDATSLDFASMAKITALDWLGKKL